MILKQQLKTPQPVSKIMKWFLGIVFFSVLFGALPKGEDVNQFGFSKKPSNEIQSEQLDVFRIDISEFISAEARLRNSSTNYQRIKDVRIFEFLDFPGLVFLHCKVEKSYSEIHVDKYLKQLIQYTIQVNAP